MTILFWAVLSLISAAREAVQPPTRQASWKHGSSSTNQELVNGSEKRKQDMLAYTYNIKDVQLGCKELRSKRYISDGSCTSVKPVTEVVCAGICLPVSELQWYTEVVDRWLHTSSVQYGCVNDIVRRKKVHLMCPNGDRRSYRVRIVRSCKCKKSFNKKNLV